MFGHRLHHTFLIETDSPSGTPLNLVASPLPAAPPAPAVPPPPPPPPTIQGGSSKAASKAFAKASGSNGGECIYLRFEKNNKD